MLKKIAVIFGVIMVIVGILGFLPQASPKGYLLGLFHVNAEHNWIHLLTGIVSLLCGINGELASRKFFQFFGVIYAIVAVLGFINGDKAIFDLIANNTADSVLHTLIAAFALYLGFGCCSTCCGSCHSENDSKDQPK